MFFVKKLPKICRTKYLKYLLEIQDQTLEGNENCFGCINNLFIDHEIIWPPAILLPIFLGT